MERVRDTNTQSAKNYTLAFRFSIIATPYIRPIDKKTGQKLVTIA